MNLLYFSLAFFLTLPVSHASPADPEPTEPSQPQQQPCTIRSSHSGAFFDLNPLHITDPALSSSDNPRDYSWNTTGYDLGYNFTMNFCGGVVEDLRAKGGVVGLGPEFWKNVSAFYEKDGKIYSIGSTSHHPVIRGRKLVLNYTHGSPCPEKHNYPDQDGNPDDANRPNSHLRRKTAIISMLCDKDPLLPKLTLSFIASPDECTYIFEARSKAGCAATDKTTEVLSPSGVFGMIAFIAFIVYIVGGCMYSRMVLNQRGWKQLPNYDIWSGITGFFWDIVVLFTSTCLRLVPGRRSYGQLNSGMRSLSRGRSGRDNEAENRLIDELNEEWDD